MSSNKKLNGFYECPDLDTIGNIKDLLKRAQNKFPDSIAYKQYINRKEEESVTFGEFVRRVDAFGTGLLNIGLENSHVAIIGETSVEWLVSYFAVLNGVGVSVPIDKELTPESMTIQINKADVDTVIVSAKSLSKVITALEDCHNVQNVILIRDYMLKEPVNSDWYLFQKDIIEAGQKLIDEGDRTYIDKPVDVKKLAAIVFTSGTTGANKGVMLSQENIWGCLKGARYLIKFDKMNFSVLPVNHTYELTCNIISALFEESTICINDELTHIAKNLKHFQPQMTCMVPEMLEGVMRKVLAEADKKGEKKKLVKAIGISNSLRKIGIDKREKMFAEVREAFGGYLDKVICGGAALSKEVEKFMDGIGVHILNGYGITECAPLVAVNGDRMTKPGSAGRILKDCNIRIWNPNDDGNGEIQVKGPNVMMGYYKLESDTKQVFTEDGWFRTGDIGHVDKDNFLYITGRLKNIIILPNGKNVYPEDVEDHLKKAIPYLDDVVICADSANVGICAICHLDEDYCQIHNLNDWRVCYEHIMPDIQKFNKNVESYKRITSTFISMEEFEKTTTHKTKRYLIERTMRNVWQVARNNPNVR